MEKIPTIFERGEHGLVINKPVPGTEWVFAGEGVATEKLDGTNVRLTVRNGTIVRVEKRRNPTKEQKGDGIRDPWYVDASILNPQDKHIMRAAESTYAQDLADGEHCCEAVGGKIQGNPLGLSVTHCVPFNEPGHMPFYDNFPREFIEMHAALRCMFSQYYGSTELAEGIVFHHPDGRRAKIKRKDFHR